jgi:hypothetical protein
MAMLSLWWHYCCLAVLRQFSDMPLYPWNLKYMICPVVISFGANIRMSY